jgi:hypothetical protein
MLRLGALIDAPDRFGKLLDSNLYGPYSVIVYALIWPQSLRPERQAQRETGDVTVIRSA